MQPKKLSLGKTARPSLTGILPRRRLFALLDRGRQGPAVWVSGPPGCGKTTLVVYSGSQPHGQPAVPPPATPATPAAPRPATPATLQARLYPANDIATKTGIVSGTVTNMMSGKGRFLLDYGGELLSGEATRVSGEERKGVASAYGAGGSYMSCEYQMNSPYQGAGTCVFSNGARYQVHIGN